MGVKVEQVTEPVLIGEGPHWDADQQCLYYVSILDHTIHKFVPSTNVETRTKLSTNVSFIVPVKGTPDLFAVGLDRKVITVKWNGESGSKAVIVSEVAEVDTEPDRITNRLNDGKADPRGCLFAGSMGREESPGQFETGKATLFVFSKNGFQKRAEKLDLSNGLCWDVNKKIMYFIDTLEFTVRAYDYEYENCIMSNQRTVFDMKKNNLEGLPDGMTIDTDGNLWVACFNGSAVVKVDPTSGKVLQKVVIPALQVTSVAFGGKNLDELYVTSGSVNITGEQKPPCGAVFKVTGLGVKGYPGVACVL